MLTPHELDGFKEHYFKRKNPTSEDDIYDFIYIRIKTKVWR